MYEIILPEPGVPEIEVKTPVGQVDLHNFAFFTGLRYESDSTLKLSWKLIGDDNSRLDGRPVDWVQLNFSGVSHLNVSPTTLIFREKNGRREDRAGSWKKPDRGCCTPGSCLVAMDGKCVSATFHHA